MKSIGFREKIMLCCLMVLVLFMTSIFLRLGTRQIFVKKMGMDNAFTRMVLFDAPTLQYKSKSNVKGIFINWGERYPFDEQQTDINLLAKAIQRGENFKRSVKNIESEKIDKWCKDNLVLYSNFVEAGRGIDKVLDWDVVTPGLDVYKMQDGYLTYCYKKIDMDEYITAVAEFDKSIRRQGGRLLYVQSPGKSNPFGDRELDRLDYANQNADTFLQGLQERGVDVFDLRQEMYKDMGNEGWHRAFFRTDHHWQPITALWAAGKLAEKLHADYGVDVNFEYFCKDDYDVVHYEDYFLGSQGKKVTLAKTTADDFDLYYPKFSTDVHIEIASLGIDARGDFSVMYDMSCVEKRDFYKANPYSAYGYGDQPEINVHNFKNEHLNDKKILIIRDSMVDSVLPFLTMGLKDITFLDIRHFTGSVRKYMEEFRPDIVVVMYNPSYGGINWMGHEDKFDFR